MKKRYDYYRNTAVAYTREADNLKKKIHLLGSIRLLLTVGLIGMLWFFKSEDWKVLVGIAIVFVLPFIAGDFEVKIIAGEHPIPRHWPNFAKTN